MELSSGRSEKDRITFFTFEHSATAIRRANGEIEITYNKNKNAHTSLLTSLVRFFCIFILPSIVKVFVIIPLIRLGRISIWWYLLPAGMCLIYSIIAIMKMRISGKENLLMNHAAEHKLYAAYVKEKTIPTIDKARRYSRINRECGVCRLSSVITCQIIGFVVFLATGYFVSEAVLVCISALYSTHFPFNLIGKFMQFFTTKEPKEENIELAIAALTALEKRENRTDFIWCKS